MSALGPTFVDEDGRVYEHVADVVWSCNVPEVRRDIERNGVEWAKKMLLVSDGNTDVR